MKQSLSFLIFFIFFSITPALAQSQRPTIAVIIEQSPTPFWSEVIRGAEQAASSLRVDLEIIQSSPASLSASLLNKIEEAPEGIIVSFPQPEQQAAAIKKAQGRRIPIASMGYYATESEELGMLFHIGRSPFLEGQMIAANFFKNGGTHILCLVDKLPHDAYCAKNYDSFTTEPFVFSRDKEASEASLRDKLTHDQNINAILLTSPNLWQQLQRVLSVKVEKPIIAATFLSPEITQALNKGEVSFVSLDQPYLQGNLAVSYMALYVRFGLRPDRNTPTGGLLKFSQ